MQERRKQYYIDPIVQGYLMKGLVLMEILLVVVMLLIFYSEINQAIEDHLFRIHTAEVSAWPPLLQVLVFVIAAFVLANLVILFLVHGIWRRYIEYTIERFSIVLERLRALDFTPAPTSQGRQHPLTSLADRWLDKESIRQQSLDQLLEQMQRYRGRDLCADDRAALRQLVEAYRRCLLSGVKSV